MDKFPEAFSRFEERVDIERIDTFRQLTLAFASWAGHRWHYTSRQMNALAIEARKRGIPIAGFRERRIQRQYSLFSTTWKCEKITVRNKSQNRYRDVRTGRFIKRP